MRIIFTIILSLVISCAEARFPRGDALVSGYLFSTFQASTSGPLRMLQSADGLNWRDRAVSYTPCNAGGYVRDPSIALFAAQNKHYIVHTNTTFNIANTTFDLAVSSDNASTFTCVQQIDMSSVSSGGNSQIWAPEFAHNDDGTPWLDPSIGGCPRVYVAASSTGLSDTGFQIYETHPTNCSDFSQPWTSPTLVTGTSLPGNMIDAYPVVSGSAIKLWIKNETDRYVGYLTSTTSAPTSGYVVTKSGDWAGWGTPLEGEAIIQIPSGPLRIYLDAESAGYTYSDSLDGGATWSLKQYVAAPIVPQHGTVIKAASVVPPDPSPPPVGPSLAYNIKSPPGGVTPAAACNGDVQTVSLTVSTPPPFSPNITVFSNQFTSGDIGKVISAPVNSIGNGANVGYQGTITGVGTFNGTSQVITVSPSTGTQRTSQTYNFTFGTSDSAAFAAFNTWALANQGSNNVVLTIPPGSSCWFGTNASANWAAGVKKLYVEGTSTTLSSVNGSAFQLGGTGVCFQGLTAPLGCSARIQSVSGGATQITLTPASFSAGYISRFSVGKVVMVGGLDTQALFTPGSGFGDPTNLNFFEWRKITAICNNTGACPGAAVITLDSPLTNALSDQWPEYNSGDIGHSDAAGPATVWVLGDSWDMTAEYRGMAISQDGQTYAQARNITYRGVTFTGGNGGIPTQNETWSAINSNYSTVQMETDKLVGTMLIDGVTIRKIVNQSTSTNRLVIRNSTFTVGLDGGAKTTEITDTSLGAWAPGIFAYGALGVNDPTTCTRCTMTGVSLTFGASDASGFWSKSSGVITMPNAAAQGSAPGQRYFVPGSPGSLVYYSASNTNPPINFACCDTIGSFQVTTMTADPWPATDNQTLSTTISITNATNTLNVPAAPFTSGDVGKTIIVNGAGIGGGVLRTWITAFTNASNVVLFNNASTTVSAAVQTIQWGTSNTYINTNQSGGFPNISAISTGLLGLKTVAAPNITCDVCNAGQPMTDGYAISVQAGATPGAALGAYMSKQYTPTSAQGNLASMLGRGIFKGLNINVTVAATAAGSVLLAPGGQFHWYMVSQNTPGAPAPIDWLPANLTINLKQIGNRAISASGVVTCNGSAGACAGDTITPPSNMSTMWIQNLAMTPYIPSTFTGAPTFTITLQTDPIQ